MYLKYLAVEGFKSFPEWNGLELDPGTCILVGANGTGKSNLTEAVCWVLGQSDSSSLRVRGPADLIFAGSDGLWPMSCGEVAVVLDRRPERTQGEGLPAGVCKHGNAASHSGELPEGALTIARRVTAAGDDVFLVDGVETEPDQVRAALLKAGVGSPPVTVIRQGELEQLLFLEPPGRRRAIEEAAGIPHLSRRRAALAAERDVLLLRREHLAGEHDHEIRQAQRLETETETLAAARMHESDIAALRAAAVRAAFAAVPEAVVDEGALLDILGLPAAEPGAESPSELRALVVEHQGRLAALGPVNSRAVTDLPAVRDRLADLGHLLAGADEGLRHLSTSIGALEAEIASEFSAALARVEQRFRSYYALLAPGGEAALPLTPVDAGTPGVDVVVRPPGKVLDRVTALSGGERSLAALSLALALFQEYPSPFFVLDEVEPALDDTNIRRLQSVLDLLADDRQILMVSHQQRAKEAGDVVFGVERNLDGASQVKFRYEPRTRRLDIFRRTWAAEHLRRHPQERSAEAPGLASAAPTGRSLGLAGSPTQAALMEFASGQSDTPAGGPGGGPSRHGRLARSDYFHPDGTFRGIWDAYDDEHEDAAAVQAEPEEGGDVKPCC
jgi:chromosome segregation ATPase